MSGDPGSGNYMLEALGMQGMFGANPYSSYPGAMPMPGYADEAPTDSLGRTISSYGSYLAGHPSTPGTTLNSTPASTGGLTVNALGGGSYSGLTPKDVAGYNDIVNRNMPTTYAGAGSSRGGSPEFAGLFQPGSERPVARPALSARYSAAAANRSARRGQHQPDARRGLPLRPLPPRPSAELRRDGASVPADRAGSAERLAKLPRSPPGRRRSWGWKLQ